MQEPIKALTQSVHADEGANYKAFREIDGAPRQLVEQHDLRRCRRQYRLLPLQLHSQARSRVRLDEARRRQRSGDRLEGPALDRRDARVCSIRRAAGSTTPTTGRGRRRARAARRRPTIRHMSRPHRRDTPRGVHAIRVLSDKKDFTLDSLIAAAYDSYLPASPSRFPSCEGVGRGARRATAEGETRGADRDPAVWDYRWRCRRCRRPSRCSGARRSAGRGADPVTQPPARQLQALAAAVDKLTGGLRHVEDAVGRHQPLPAPQRRHRVSRSTMRAEYSGGLHFVALGIARVVRRARVSGTRRNGTAPSATASWPWSSSATGPREGRHGGRGERGPGGRSISTTKPNATLPAICARCTSTPNSSRVTRNARTTRASK